MNEIIKAQGKQKKVKLGTFNYIVRSSKVGKVKEINNEIIAKIARVGGAPEDKGAGLFLNKKVGDKVKKGEVLYTIYAENKFKLGLSKEFVKKDRGYLIN